MNARFNPIPPQAMHVNTDTCMTLAKLMLDGYGKCVEVQFEATRALLGSIQQQSELMGDAQKTLLRQLAEIQGAATR